MIELLHFKRFEDKRGVLIPIEGERDIPFAIKRRWIIKNVPAGEIRGDHAHRRAQQVIIAIVGAFKVNASWRGSDSLIVRTEILESNDTGLYIPPSVHVTLFDFTPDSVCEVLSDTYYDEEGYEAGSP